MRHDIGTFQSGPFELVYSVSLPDGPGPHPGVLFCHGFTGHRIESRRMYSRLARRLAAAGIASFRFDHRGCGDSEGDFSDFTPTGMLEDLDAALGVFLSRPWLERGRMAVVGYSLGGLAASYVLGRCADFCTAVYWAPVARPDIIRDRLATLDGFELYRQQGYFDLSGFRVSRAYIDYIGEIARPLDWVREFPGPILFLHGADDDIVKPEQSERYIAVRKNPGDRKVVVPGADHSFSTAPLIDRVLDESEAWLLARLIPPA